MKKYFCFFQKSYITFVLNVVELFFSLNYIHFVLDNRGEESYNTSTGETVVEIPFLCLCVAKFDPWWGEI